ncbi:MULTISPECIES: alpha/beta hydrolase [Streptomycetaceae]|uniref:Putative secreted protein n=1 Tax=Streptantibioticus cattleyicolor (strain ATCC 35852 / DSM 46488 / JCM 4925 / NBRC 14057 / NRRL 8057) TaxID=1003195 RepID=F8JY21_STREN|nr:MULTISPECIES: alpha/beta hydrolase [Streptomycetaceae]AEW93405.1 putative secreted protein [Streptantibioticus cattleyicolor NRRL 8057 = DSM 46488]MYS58119.1 alpha/beta hydrolase [Streptomyces sp. SID5468]CCB73761.1 putative secreted protein [Streptantibioticus cattleyicolor NRRL 8057 = DSM 46488]
MRTVRTAALLAATCAGAGLATVAAGRYVCDLALRPRHGGTALAGPPAQQAPPLTVHRVEPGRITLSRCLTSVRPGRYGLAGAGCHAVVGPVVETRPDSVTRELESVQFGDFRPGTRVRITPQLHTGDPAQAHGVAFHDVTVDGELGPMPAWLTDGARDTWVIAVHGLGTTREHPLNLLPFWRRARMPALLISYRNDPGAPDSADRIGHLGDTEWADVDAALRYAVRGGARRVVLHGWSTGAAMALRVADHSPLRGHVSGLILDSPVLEWQAAVRGVARSHHVPDALVPLAVRAAQGRTGLHAERLADSAEPDRLTVPTLVVHGPDDTIAPWEPSRELAARRPDLVTLRTVPRAEHQAMWNADPTGYEEALRRFLTPLV